MKKYYQTTLRLWNLLKPFHSHFYLQLFLIVLTQLINIFTVYLIAQVLNNIINKTFDQAVLMSTFWILAYLVWTVINYYKNFHQSKYIDNAIQQYLEEFSFKKIFNLNPSQYIEDHSAVKLQVINRGENSVENIISTIVLNLFPTLSQVILSLIAISFYSIPIALLCLAIFLIALFWTTHFTEYHRPFIKKNIDNWDDQRKIRTEAFQHLSLIKISAVTTYYLEKYLKNRNRIVQHTIDTWEKANLHNNKRWFFFSFGRYLSTLIIIYQYSINQLTAGSIYAIWTWLGDVFGNIHNVSQAMRQIPLNFVELEKYLDIIDKEPIFNEIGIKKFEMGNIAFENMSFKYPKSESDVIDNLNLTIEQGKKTAFVGFSGSGKSTIVKLLLRIYDWNSGEIYLAGKSLRELDAQTLRKKVGYVEQHVDLFDISIKDNILFGITSGKLSEEKLNEVVFKSRIEEFFHRLGTAGLDTVIGERGVKLSGGERQRIGIARALAKDPEILIFDEATASLDTENEKYIQEAIDESSKGRTTIIIAHRLSTVQNADKIIVMDKGKIVGEGTHAELAASNEYYQRLIRAQN